MYSPDLRCQNRAKCVTCYACNSALLSPSAMPPCSCTSPEEELPSFAAGAGLGTDGGVFPPDAAFSFLGSPTVPSSAGLDSCSSSPSAEKVLSSKPPIYCPPRYHAVHSVLEPLLGRDVMSIISNYVEEEPLQIIYEDRVVFLLKHGRIYSWGHAEGPLGRPVSGKGVVAANFPSRVRLPGDARCMAIEAKNSRVFALDTEGQIYSWGNKKFLQDLQSGQRNKIHLLARPLSDKGSVAANYPGLVSMPESIKCSSMRVIEQSIVVLDRKGNVYSWDYKTMHYVNSLYSPAYLLRRKYCRVIEMAGDYIFVLSRDGCIYSGESEYSNGPLGRSPKIEGTFVEKDHECIHLPGDAKCTFMNVGHSCAFAIDTEGRVYSWGTDTALLGRPVSGEGSVAAN